MGETRIKEEKSRLPVDVRGSKTSVLKLPTTTPKTIIENGAIRKRFPEWSDLKTMLFENAVF